MNREFSNICEGLNTAQSQAVEQFEGPSLIVAGAGSGKTKVLTCRIANILNHGHKAGSVLALTFTNKASKEMKERISTLVGSSLSKNLWMGTFHSIFVRFLREDAELLGFPKSFTIYDTSDSRSAIRNCVREMGLDEKIYKPNEVLSRISMAKNNLVTSAAYLSNAELIQRDAIGKKPKVGEIYQLYEKKCRQAGAMDFDDILLNTNILLRDFPDVLEKLRNRFSFILVDEYQDTNFSQYLIVKKLSSGHRNVCVVGDDSQSIYSFRGARIENILNFLKDYPEAKEFKLEQNYRSTQTIVKAANSLISRNSNRLNKECFSTADTGEKIEIVKGYTDQEEAFTLASSILSNIYDTKAEYSDFAVLYRTNAQSRVVEEALRKRSLPYKIYGGHSFYDRAEVKDVMSYMRLLVNPKDDEALRRVVNVPPRGIGDTTMSNLAAAAGAASVSMWEALHTGDLASFGIKAAAAARLLEFTKLISEVSLKVRTVNAYEISMEIVLRSGYMTFLKSDTSIEGQARVENVEELFNSIKEFEGDALGGVIDEEQNDTNQDLNSGENRIADSQSVESQPENGSVLLENFLENISLMSAVDEKVDKEDNNKISLMTVHSAKGLEFPYIYVIGMEENLFPSLNASSSESEIEEERRLFYVALTRAKKRVTLSYAQSRFRWGANVNYPPSRFLKEIDKQYVNWPASDSENVSAGLFDKWGSPSDDLNYTKSYNRPSNSRYHGSAKPNSGPSSAFTNSTSPRSGFGSSGQNSGLVPSQSAPTFSKKSLQSEPRTTPFIPDPVEKLKEKMRVEHDRFGYGTIFSLEGDFLNMRAIVDFDEGGRKTLLLKFAKLRIAE
ncbi:MAG: 3'-5' exonuclease [Bacteroidales bacterium]|nr:3'-5' exonuclease [Bacteroidales bacterium]